MALEAYYKQEGWQRDYTPAANITGGTVIQLADGLAGVMVSDTDADKLGAVRVAGHFTVDKASGVVFLDGGQVFWDHSANVATYRQVSDRDFFLGTAVGDATSASTSMVVDLNRRNHYKVDFSADSAANSVIVGTAAAGGFGYPIRKGGSNTFLITSTNEAQKVDLLSIQGWATGANAIVEGAFRVVSDGSGTATDVSLGCASATSATDADAIAESVFIHLNGNEANIYAESDDGTTEVAATDTTIDYTEGSALSTRVEFWMDMRDPAAVKIYINGAQVLSSTTFNLSAATGPWFLLAHIEKTASTDTYELAVDWLRVRTSEK
jgi:predicted RecA/RadA family phage recombinase